MRGKETQSAREAEIEKEAERDLQRLTEAGAGAGAAAGSPPEGLDVLLLQKPKTPLQSDISKPLLSYEEALSPMFFARPNSRILDIIYRVFD